MPCLPYFDGNHITRRDGRSYSFRNATTGSTAAARRAGMYAAIKAAQASKAVTAENVVHFTTTTLYKALDRARISRYAAGAPIASPIPATRQASPNVILIMSDAAAPTAIRMPIS